MADPVAMLDAKARELYEAWIEDGGRKGWDWNPFSGERIKPREWHRLDNHSREVWRGKALAVLRSEETLADELRREERQRAAAGRSET